MSPAILAVQALMIAALALNIRALVLAVRFLNRHKREGQSLLHPLDGLSLWMGLVSAGAFGEAAEPERKRAIRAYLLSFALFAAAVALFVVFPPVPS